MPLVRGEDEGIPVRQVREISMALVAPLDTNDKQRTASLRRRERRVNLYIYSGKCRVGTVGQPTKFKDMSGKPLFVGDIVCTFTDGYLPEFLTVVVSEEFTTYSDGIHKIHEGPISPFVMGIKGVDLESPNEWRVKKLKDHSDVIDGEKWAAWGFNFKAEPQRKRLWRERK